MDLAIAAAAVGGLLHVEAHALREGQLVGVVDGARAAAHVLLPRVGAAANARGVKKAGEEIVKGE